MKFEVAVLGSPSLIVLIIYYLCGRKATLNWSYIAQVRTIHKPAYLPTYLPTYPRIGLSICTVPRPDITVMVDWA